MFAVPAGILLAVGVMAYGGVAHTPDPPPTAYESAEIVVPEALEVPDAKPHLSNVCANVGDLGMAGAVEAMVASSVELGGDPDRAMGDIRAGIEIDCPEMLGEFEQEVGGR